jgi:hypothetical protein
MAGQVKQGAWTLNGRADAHGRLDIKAPSGPLHFQLDNWGTTETGSVQMFDYDDKALSGNWKLLRDT